MHDLIRSDACDRAAADPERGLERLLDYYQHTAAITQSRLARLTRARLDPAVLTSPPTAVPVLPDRTRALCWARDERANLLACLDHVTGTGQHARVVALTAAIAALLRQDGSWTGAITRHATAVQAARQLGDRRGEANALNDLGDVRYLVGEYPGAAEAHQNALGIYRVLGDRGGEAEALNKWEPCTGSGDTWPRVGATKENPQDGPRLLMDEWADHSRKPLGMAVVKAVRAAGQHPLGAGRRAPIGRSGLLLFFFCRTDGGYWRGPSSTTTERGPTVTWSPTRRLAAFGPAWEARS